MIERSQGQSWKGRFLRRNHDLDQEAPVTSSCFFVIYTDLVGVLYNNSIVNVHNMLNVRKTASKKLQRMYRPAEMPNYTSISKKKLSNVRALSIMSPYIVCQACRPSCELLRGHLITMWILCVGLLNTLSTPGHAVMRSMLVYFMANREKSVKERLPCT